MTLLGIVGGALLVAVVSATLKETGKGFVPFLLAGGGVLLTAWAVGKLGEGFRLLSSFSSWETLSPYVGALLKGLGVAYVVHIGADICRDLGATGVATKLELCGKAELLLIALPYLGEVISLALSLCEGGL